MTPFGYALEPDPQRYLGTLPFCSYQDFSLSWEQLAMKIAWAGFFPIEKMQYFMVCSVC